MSDRPVPKDDLEEFMLDQIDTDPDMAARFMVADYRQRAERAEAEVGRLRWALQGIADGGFPATIIARRALSPDEGTEQ